MSIFQPGAKLKFKQELINWVREEFVEGELTRPPFKWGGISTHLNNDGDMNETILKSEYVVMKRQDSSEHLIAIEGGSWYVWNKAWFEPYQEFKIEAEEL